jgi:hypothetical protein
MNAKKLAAYVLGAPCFQSEPPVLVDLGASGALHPDWEILAPYSVCLGFDADERDFSKKIADSAFKKLHLINRIVTSQDSTSVDFYLTRSPHCSSSLLPRPDLLADWKFSAFFEVEQKINLPAVKLDAVLRDLGIQKIDWYKTDTQGTDLRIFESLPQSIQRSMILVEFEPGIIDAYQDEDKLRHVLAFMERMPFWPMSLYARGTQRISVRALQANQIDPGQRLSTANAACWAEIEYFHDFKEARSDRDILLAWLILTLKNQHAFALELMTGRHTIDAGMAATLTRVSKAKLMSPARIFKERVKNKLHQIVDRI